MLPGSAIGGLANMAEEPHVSETLFKPNFVSLRKDFLEQRFPYPIAIDSLFDSSDPRFDVTELSAFSQVLEHERAYYESRGFVSGPVTVCIEGQTYTLDSNCLKIPAFVESDWLRILRCASRYLLVIESRRVFDDLCSCRRLRDMNIILLTGSGIPRMSARRLVRRLQEEFSVSVHLLTDNDTWGYFIYSTLARGAISPDVSFPWLSVKDIHFIGLRAGDGETLGINEQNVCTWRPLWDMRIECFRSYDCFRSSEWQSEFDAFEKQHYGLNLDSVIQQIGADQFVEKYLEPKLAI
jgi:DNA topoisomerase VI subunit A